MKYEVFQKSLKTIATLHDYLLAYHRPEIYGLRSHIDFRYIIWVSLLELDFPCTIKWCEIYCFFFALIFDGCPEIAP
jgi:hypothetical protein